MMLDLNSSTWTNGSKTAASLARNTRVHKGKTRFGIQVTKRNARLGGGAVVAYGENAFDG
jgi:hypothetical protein